MIPINFRVAMLNRLRLGPYDHPHLTGTVAEEWLIVERVGRDGELLRISDATTLSGDTSGYAPADLQPRNTIVALLAEPETEEDEGPQFLMVRHLPLSTTVQGSFFPADGYARLARVNGTLILNAFGRHAHTKGEIAEAVVFHDIPRPAPNAEGAINWHFNAEERSWTAQRGVRKRDEI